MNCVRMFPPPSYAFNIGKFNIKSGCNHGWLRPRLLSPLVVADIAHEVVFESYLFDVETGNGNSGLLSMRTFLIGICVE